MKFKFAFLALLVTSLVFGALIAEAGRHHHDDDYYYDDDYRGSISFRLENNTGYTIRRVYVSPSAKDDWQSCKISGGSIEDGESATVRFDTNSNARYWDLRCVYTNGREIQLDGVNLPQSRVVEVYKEGDFETR